MVLTKLRSLKKKKGRSIKKKEKENVKDNSKERKNRRSRKVRKPIVYKPIVYTTSELIPLPVLKNKNNGKPHNYEDVVESHIDKDFAIIALFDGHTGQFSSKKATILIKYLVYKIKKGIKVNSELLIKSFEIIDSKYLNKTNSGCTGTIIYIDKKIIYTAHVGDSPAYGISNKGCSITQLTKDHDYFNLSERNRVISAAKKLGISEPWEDQRVHGTIQSSRGLGDPEIKEMGKGMFIATPEVSSFNPKKFKYLMITSDGITDPFTEKYESKNTGQDDFTKLNDKQQSKNLLKNLVISICEKDSKSLKTPVRIIKDIVGDAIKMVGSNYQDDISIILIDVKQLFISFKLIS